LKGVRLKTEHVNSNTQLTMGEVYCIALRYFALRGVSPRPLLSLK